MTRCLLTVGVGLLVVGCGATDDQPITDSALRIMWSKRVSRLALPWSVAPQYCREHRFATYSDWRLPTKTELESIVNPELVDEAPNSNVVPLYGPFTEPSDGHLFSGTVVDGYEDAPYVMNLRNGHIFNGTGYEALVRCVRDMRFEGG